MESAREVQEGIEAARGEAAASQREAAERETPEPVTQDDAGTEDVQGRINAASERATETAAAEMADDVQERIDAARDVREGVEAIQSSAAASQREAPEPVNTAAENVQERIQAARERATDTASGDIPEPGEAEVVHERFPLRAPGMSS